MRILILHLSDIHINRPQDAVLNRADSIVNAVKNLDYSLDACVIAITGDIAFSGRQEQYELALRLLLPIVDHLTERLVPSIPTSSVPITVIAVPGNHDCEFSASGTIRSMAIDAILRDSSMAKDPDVIEHCLQPQQSFFELRDALGPSIQAHNSTYGDQLYYEYSVKVGDENIRFLCCNTAWLSRLHENQGGLYFPPDALPQHTNPDTVAIAMFH